jgi:hypothetical protein
MSPGDGNCTKYRPKCLAVQKEDRYQSAQEVQRDLEGWLGAPTTFRTVMGTHAAKEGTGNESAVLAPLFVALPVH